MVTGGASGIGKATTLRMCAAGARVMVGDVDEAAAEQLLSDAAMAGHAENVRFRRTDVSAEDDVAALIAAAVAEFGDLHVMFNNAGVSDTLDPIVEVPVEHWDRVFAVNARGVFLGIKHSARAMLAAEHGGAIVNTASIDGLSASSGFPSYSAAKAAVINLTRVAAVELAPARIRVNVICPGGVLTPMLARGDVEGARTWLEKLQPWPEAGLPEDVAAVVEFLASDDARFITGESVTVDGGLMAGGARLVDKIRARLQAGAAASGTTSEEVSR
ncbi:SDR family oxidoreductase [Mycobacterium sp. SMC-2]|uniref:SDR family NAD(P)-dependent oxidoreductase n=1 Tax=Mycobacterium sp. SMC-2 TaxID=2857058 RepID=UPI0021B4528D|nr:SDR family oxidoreductase [Mycobacterium sp. SMC-2]UXA05348.1 SDR family oxidoreductase [Mycobacterium sp. SMC-2]